MNKLTILGTGNAVVTHCYNTCFTLQTDSTTLLVDAGGGNGILARLESAGIAIGQIHHMFVTHAHTDHILGTVWVIRMVVSKPYEGKFHIYGHDKALNVIDTICRMTFAAKHLAAFAERVEMHCLCDGEQFRAGDIAMECFDIHSTKEKQFGFRATLTDGTTVACLGDEPYNPLNEQYARRADFLLCEAFCLYADRERFHPYEKHHSTALDAGRVAASLGAGTLVLYHTEDKTLATRRATYTAEAASLFAGNIVVPDDGEVIPLCHAAQSSHGEACEIAKNM